VRQLPAQRLTFDELELRQCPQLGEWFHRPRGQHEFNRSHWEHHRHYRFDGNHRKHNRFDRDHREHGFHGHHGQCHRTGSSNNPGGLVNSPNSFSGQVVGLGRFFFDGNGNIVGQAPGGVGDLNMSVGSFSVNYDCTATIKMNSGQTYDAVVVNSGAQVLFLESDKANRGQTGTLSSSPNFCGSNYS
jgi:hypothetical protein